MMHTKHFSHPSCRSVVTLLLTCILAACNTPGEKYSCSTSTAESLNGVWTVQLAVNNIWMLQLAPHPEHTGSWRGELTQGAQRFAVVADLDDGEFTMEESHDGQRIAATWLGKLETDSCELILSGERRNEQGTASPFVVLRDRSR